MALTSWRYVLALAAVLSASFWPSAAPVFAADSAASIDGEFKPLPEHMIVVKKLVKMAVFCAAALLIILCGIKAAEFVLPVSLKKDVVEGKNTAAGIFLAGLAAALGLSVCAALSAL